MVGSQPLPGTRVAGTVVAHHRWVGKSYSMTGQRFQWTSGSSMITLPFTAIPAAAPRKVPGYWDGFKASCRAGKYALSYVYPTTLDALTCRVQDCDSLVDSSSEAATVRLGVAADFLASERFKLSAFAADLPIVLRPV